jgi:hypothetical protein
MTVDFLELFGQVGPSGRCWPVPPLIKPSFSCLELN